jgi:hypothetical protein
MKKEKKEFDHLALLVGLVVVVMFLSAISIDMTQESNAGAATKSKSSNMGEDKPYNCYKAQIDCKNGNDFDCRQYQKMCIDES